MEADGAATFAVRLTVPYAMGLGVPGGTRLERIDWSWEAATLNQDSLWLGDANIGMQLALRDDNYERPLNTNFYREKPLIAPQSWANPGAAAGGGVTLRESGGDTEEAAVVLQAFSGGRTLAPGDSLNYGFRVLLTPFKPIAPAHQLRNRYFHDQGSVAEIAATGASVITIHHAGALAPFINDPLLHTDTLAEYSAQAHAAGLKIKVYDTVRELTGHSPDLLPMLLLGHEIFSDAGLRTRIRPLGRGVRFGSLRGWIPGRCGIRTRRAHPDGTPQGRGAGGQRVIAKRAGTEIRACPLAIRQLRGDDHPTVGLAGAPALRQRPDLQDVRPGQQLQRVAAVVGRDDPRIVVVNVH